MPAIEARGGKAMASRVSAKSSAVGTHEENEKLGVIEAVGSTRAALPTQPTSAATEAAKAALELASGHVADRAFESDNAEVVALAAWLERGGALVVRAASGCAVEEEAIVGRRRRFGRVEGGERGEGR
jgi:hypothetical protein